MTSQSFDVTVRRTADIAIMDLHGQVDRGAEQSLNEAYDEVSHEHAGPLFLNFSGVDYINSTGIAVIVSLLARARKDERRLVVYGLSDHYRTIFEITRLVDFMQIYANEESALADAGQMSG
jgi:anti-sigma B factor antagonist